MSKLTTQDRIDRMPELIATMDKLDQSEPGQGYDRRAAWLRRRLVKLQAK